MRKNYYLILGVASNATTNEIKTAFRRRAQQLHPDHSGSEGGPFLEIKEAYGVLSDPQRRRNYDRQSRTSAVRRRPWGPSAQPAARRGAEPFGAGEPGNVREATLNGSFSSFHPSFDELFDRFWSNFEGFARPKAERLESPTMEVVLSSEEARRGERVRVWIPARATCPACGGAGAAGPYECWRCQGQGALTSEYPVEIGYPPGMQDGYAVKIPLIGFGVENFYLTLLLRVSRGVTV